MRLATLATALVVLAAIPTCAFAGEATPSPSPTPPPGTVTWTFDGQNVFIDQQTAGPGITPPEGPQFANGSPLSPNTPYDTWSSAVQVPGLAGILQYRAAPTYHGKHVRASVELGAGLVSGSVTNAAYWGENLLPTYNPHLGNGALPYSILFPTAPGTDSGEAFRLSILSGAVGAEDGSWSARAGYFDLTQSDRFIFIQPTFTSVTPGLTVAPAESLTTGAASLSWWPSPEPGLPLLGVDLNAHKGIAGFELSNAALPALAGSSARATIGSAFIDHGEGTKYTAELLHVTTAGAPISTTTMFGANAATVPGPQGELPVSTLGGQRATVAGASGSFHVTKALAAVVEIARQWYDADNTFEPGTQRPGGYYHAALTRKVRRTSATAEWFRFEPRYATVILPYGVPENVWSSAWSWPGQWLKSNYQINDNTSWGVNRQGYRLRYFVDGGAFEWHLQVENYRQIDEATLSNVNQTGFVDGFFLPQANGYGTRGSQQQYAGWLAWHPRFGTVTLDYIVDEEHRPAYAAHPEDLVDYIAPQVAVTYSKQIASSTVVAAGYARYAMRGTWATSALDYGQSTFFGGAEFKLSPVSGLLVELRHGAFIGIPDAVNGSSPAYHGNLLLVEQRVHF